MDARTPSGQSFSAEFLGGAIIESCGRCFVRLFSSSFGFASDVNTNSFVLTDVIFFVSDLYT